MSAAEKIRAPITISATHPAYAGHFPGMPIVPGVVLLDRALSAIGTSMPIECARGELASAKFHSPVSPGEPLWIEYELSAGGSIRFTLSTQDRRVATGVWKPQ